MWWGAAELSIRGLNVAIRNVQILREVSLELPQGGMAGLIGRNGAGKTTLLRILATLIRPHAGAVQINGHALPREDDVWSRPNRR